MIIKKLEWERFFCDAEDGSPREHAITPFGTEYHISHEGWWFPLRTLTLCKDIEEARDAVKKDFEVKVLSSIEAL